MKKIFSVLLGVYILFNIAYGYDVTINGATVKAVNAGRLVTITAPEKPGHTFSNWEVVSGGITLQNAESRFTSFIMPSRDVVINPVYTEIYTVTYNANGGIGAPDAQEKLSGVNLTLSNAIPVYTNRTFNGWNTSSDGSGTDYTPGQTYTANANLTLYAKWITSEYTVSYNANGGRGEPTNQTKTNGVSLTLSSTEPVYANTNTTTKELSTVAVGSYVDYRGGDYNGKWVVLRNEAGNVEIISKESVGRLTLIGADGYANAVKLLNDKSKEYVNTNYAISGRSVGATNESIGQINTRIYPLTYMVSTTRVLPYYDTYYTDDQTLILNNSELWHTNETYVWMASRFLDTSANSYSFNVRYIKANGEAPSADSSSSSTLYKTLSTTTTNSNSRSFGVRPVITLKTNLKIIGGTGTSSDPYIIVPNLGGCTFIGWNTAKDGSGTTYLPGGTYTYNSDVTLYAQWSSSVYTITYDKNTTDIVTNMPTSQEKIHGTNLTLSNTIPVYDGHTFIGWNTAADGTGTSYARGATYTANAAATLYAQWTTNTYSVTYNKNTTDTVTNMPGNQTKTYGVDLELSDLVPVYEGRTFTGWNTAANGSGTTYNPGDTYNTNQATTLYAQWVIGDYTITYNKNTTDVVTNLPASQSKLYGTTLILSETIPVYPGWTFIGWNTEVNGEGTSYTAGGEYTLNESTTLYAQWTLTPYTITYDANGGTNPPASHIKYHGESVGLSSAGPTYEGRTFTGWNTAADGSGTAYAPGAIYSINASVTLYAQWATDAYTVTYNANGGTGAPSNQIKTHGTALVLTNSIPVYTGRTFSGWNTETDGTGTTYSPGASYTTNEDVTLYAQWTVNTYMVKYNANGGIGAPANQTKTYGEDLVLSDTIPTSSTGVFSGWNTAQNGSGTSYAAGATYSTNEAVTLYAQWTTNTYTVTYNANSGTGAPANQIKAYGSALVLSSTIPTYDGRMFAGWNTEIDGSGTAYVAGGTYTADADVTLYAQWILNTYTIIYNVNGGAGAPSNQTKTYGVDLELRNTIPLYAGRTFNGWNTAADGSGTAYDPGETYSVNESATLYAQWTVNTFTVTYNKNTGEAVTNMPENQTKIYTEDLVLSDVVPVYSGRAFNGWNTEADGSGTTYVPGGTYNINEAVTLYAQWSTDTFDVIYNWNGGTTGPENQEKTYGVNLTLSSTAPTHPGGTFIEWNTAQDGSGTSYAPGATYTANAVVILYAQWNLETYTIVYNKNTIDTVSNIPGNQTKIYGVNLTLNSTIPTRTGYTFTGWNTASNGSGISYSAGGTCTANNSAILYAQWSINTYQITYNANGGTGAPASQTKNYGTDLILRNTVPTYAGHTFNSWNTAQDGSGTSYAPGATYSLNEAVTLYAQWDGAIPKYTVTYDANSGSGAPASQTKTHNVSLTLSSTIPTRSGYRFTGWNTVANGSGTTYVAGGSYTTNASTTLYAQWVQQYTLTNETYTDGVSSTIGGTWTGAATYDTGTTVNVVATPKSGYAFRGWTVVSGTAAGLNTSVASTSFTISEAVILRANFAQVYTIAYNANNGSGAQGSQTKYYGETLTLSSTVPTRSGYRFAGWNTVANGSGTMYASGADYTANAGGTLYAQWIQQYTLTNQTYTNGTSSTTGGTWTGSGTYDTGTIVNVVATPKSGYDFTGWTVVSGTATGMDLEASSTSFTITGPVTLRANFVRE